MVTGAGSGIGEAAASAFVAAGDAVWFADLDGEAAARGAASLGARALTLDVTQEAAWACATRTLCDAGNGLDVLVNAAGISRTAAPADVLAADLEGWRRVFAVNVEGVMLGCRTAVDLMGARRRDRQRQFHNRPYADAYARSLWCLQGRRTAADHQRGRG